MDKELRVLPGTGHCWENSFQHDRALVKILFKSMTCLNERVEMCYSCNDQWAHDGTGRDTRGMQELLDVMHKQTQSSELLSKRKLRHSVHHFFLYAEMEVAEALRFQVPTVLERVGLFSGSYQSRVSTKSSVI